MKDPADIFGQFSSQARKILTTAQQVAESMSSGIGSEHILIGLAVTPATIAHELLKEYAITLEQIRLILALNDLVRRTDIGLTDEAKTLLKVALRMAARYQHEQVEPEHLLLAMTTLRTSRAFQVISRVGVNPAHLRVQLEELLGSGTNLRLVIEPDAFDHDHDHDEFHNHDHGGHEADDPNWHDVRETTLANLRLSQQPTKKGKLLDIFAIDLAAQALAGQLDPLIGRQKELERLIHILARRTKNNPVLIGEPGVGKTAIVEGLAQRIAGGAVPPILQGRRIFRLDLALLVAGTMYRGQFEERLKKLLAEVQADRSIILFIDELHTVVGTGSAEGATDAANILKPALARGDIRVIGATTLEEYRKYIEKDAALERRFQTIIVQEPTVEETTAILKGLKVVYENHHQVVLTDEALTTAARLAARYLPDRQLPDAAIDLLDEAAAAKRLAAPTGHQQKSIAALKQKLEAIMAGKDQAIEKEAFGEAASLRIKEQHLTNQLKMLSQREENGPNPTVEVADIARTTAALTGIPLDHLSLEQRLPINHLADRIKDQVVCQDEAVAAIVAAIERSAAGISRPNRPLGSFLFLGPTGVGKTELARVLSYELYGRQDAMIKIDMSEFMERHTIARLVGAPAGYIGFEEGGKLTEAVRRRPWSLIVLDEFDKAHPDVAHLLLQILEDGVLTDARGRRVSFANTTIILTANIGSQELTKFQALGFQTSAGPSGDEGSYQQLRSRILEALRDRFAPEFLNRLDAQIVFRPLTPEAMAKITDVRLIDLAERLAAVGYRLIVTPVARAYLAKTGFDPDYGARPLSRLMTDTIETPLAQLVLESAIKPGDTLVVGGSQAKGVTLSVRSQHLKLRPQA